MVVAYTSASTTKRLVNEPVVAVNVDAATFVAENVAESVTTRLPKVAVSFSIVLASIPDRIGDRPDTSAIECPCPMLAKLLVAAEIAASSPLISEAECACPSSDTDDPFTVKEEALMLPKSTFERDIVTSPVTVNVWNVAAEADSSSASTFVAVNEADATIRFVNVPVSFVMSDDVMPSIISESPVMLEMA